MTETTARRHALGLKVVNLELPRDLGLKVSVASAMSGVSQMEWIRRVLASATRGVVIPEGAGSPSSPLAPGA